MTNVTDIFTSKKSKVNENEILKNDIRILSTTLGLANPLDFLTAMMQRSAMYEIEGLPKERQDIHFYKARELSALLGIFQQSGLAWLDYASYRAFESGYYLPKDDGDAVFKFTFKNSSCGNQSPFTLEIHIKHSTKNEFIAHYNSKVNQNSETAVHLNWLQPKIQNLVTSFEKEEALKNQYNWMHNSYVYSPKQECNVMSFIQAIDGDVCCMFRLLLK